MKVELLSYTDLSVCDIAISKCYGKEPYEELEKQQARINRVANVSKHASTIEHLVYSFDIDGVSRALLQELARHRIASYTVKSSRYTLKELSLEEPFMEVLHNEPKHGFMSISTDINRSRASKYLVFTGIDFVDNSAILALEGLRGCISLSISNDKAKYCMPEAYKTSLVMTINARSLQNFLSLRSSKHALWEIQLLANAMYDCIPGEHKFLFENVMNELLEKPYGCD